MFIQISRVKVEQQIGKLYNIQESVVQVEYLKNWQGYNKNPENFDKIDFQLVNFELDFLNEYRVCGPADSTLL